MAALPPGERYGYPDRGPLQNGAGETTYSPGNSSSSASDAAEIAAIKTQIEGRYGIKFDDVKVLEDMRGKYRTPFNSDLLKKAKTALWRKEQILGFEKALAHFAPILTNPAERHGIWRNHPQEISFAGSLYAAFNKKFGSTYLEDGKGSTTAGEFCEAGKSIAGFELGETSPALRDLYAGKGAFKGASDAVRLQALWEIFSGSHAEFAQEMTRLGAPPGEVSREIYFTALQLSLFNMYKASGSYTIPLPDGWKNGGLSDALSKLWPAFKGERMVDIVKSIERKKTWEAHFVHELTHGLGLRLLKAFDKVRGKEKPVTEYGKENAKEDLCEAVKFHMLAPHTLEKVSKVRADFLGEKNHMSWRKTGAPEEPPQDWRSIATGEKAEDHGAENRTSIHVNHLASPLAGSRTGRLSKSGSNSD